MNTQPNDSSDERKASIVVHVNDDEKDGAAVRYAEIALHWGPRDFKEGNFDPHGEMPTGFKFIDRQATDQQGRHTFAELTPGWYVLTYMHLPKTTRALVYADAGKPPATVHITPHICAQVSTQVESGDAEKTSRPPRQGDVAMSTLHIAHSLHGTALIAPARGAVRVKEGWPALFSTFLSHAGNIRRAWGFRLPLDTKRREEHVDYGSPRSADAHAEVVHNDDLHVAQKVPVPITGNIGVSLTRTETESTEDLALWTAIRSGTDALSFNNYLHFMELLFGDDRSSSSGRVAAEKRLFHQLKNKRLLPFSDTDAYRVLKAATEAFVMVNCAVLRSPDFDQVDDNDYLDRRDLPGFDERGGFDAAFEHYLEPLGPLGRRRVLPYLALVRRKLPDIAVLHADQDLDNLRVGFVQDKLVNPCLVELIWSYWLEEGMLVQTMNAVTRRFQNIRSPSTPDPLANLEIDPLRPLNNMIWGYTQDEQHRLTVNRRNYEYDHHYGIRLHGRAIRTMRAADTRSQFLESFHHLLRLCTVFFKQDDDTTVKADAFPVLNALKEVHLVMSQGAHNQFGDLPSTARIEMLMQQWLLARPEFREFLPTRIMVAYPEPWMDRVDAMKKLQGWTDTSVVHFRNLAIFGEQLLLSIRYGAWSEVFEPNQAFNWARFWRPQIQGYNHAYRAATGVELSGETSDKGADATLPSLLLQRRLAAQQRTA
jgi:hypothetical protein